MGAGPAEAYGLDGKGGAPITVLAPPNDRFRVYGYARPSTEFRELASGTVDSQGRAYVTLRVTGNTRFYVTSDSCPFPSPQRVINVRDRFGALTAHRNGPRDYTFATFYAGPAGKVGNLYRVLPDGRQVLTSQTRLGGQFATIRRVFTGSGRFGFLLRTGSDINSVGSTTNVRDTVIH